MSTTLTVTRHTSTEALKLYDAVVPVYAAANHGQLHDPWYHPDRFWERFVELYAPGRDFSLVVGWLGETAISYTFGSPRDNAVPFWTEVRTALPELAAPGTDESVYVFRELAVHPDHHRQGHGRTMHDALLADRPERLATLVVRKNNVPAQAAYRSWGWRKLGDRQPFPDSPVFDELVRPLTAPA